MSNEQVRLAREWAKDANSAFLTDRAIAARDYILATTKEQTMADVEWDDERHHLTGASAEHSREEVVMFGSKHGMVDVMRPDGTRPIARISASSLTPNGKRYALREIGENPTELSSEDDYRDAPIGTIVVKDPYGPWTKKGADYWTSAPASVIPSVGLFHIGPHRVLRMGDGS